MPFIISRTNRSISREQEKQLKTRLGKAIELVPGKSEQYLMLGFEDNCHLWLRGDDSKPMAYIEAAIWGNEAHLGYDEFTQEVTRIFHDVLGIAPDCIYIRYSDIPDWGVDGMNFDRNKYIQDMNKVTLTTFTDPMMGLSYECEPIFRKLETHFAGQIEFRYSMGLLVRNVYELCDCNELAQSPALGLHRYNARLAKIYENEEQISGMPINMDGFCLFSTEETSSLPLNLAYKAAELTAPELSDRFLYSLRYATIVETLPTTKLEEILKVVRLTGIDEKLFLQHFQDSSAETALDSDLTRMHALGIHTLPAYLLEYEGKQMLIRHLIGYDAFVDAIRELTDGRIHPQPVEQSLVSVRQLLEQHPLISPIELREAFDFNTTDDVRQFIQPMVDSGEVSIRDVKRGWFIVKEKGAI